MFMDFGGEESDFIPLISDGNEEELNLTEVPATLPILPLRNTVLFPGVVIPITVGREKSIALVKEAYRGNKVIGVVAQKENSIDEPGLDDLQTVGTVANIIKILNMPDETTSVIIHGKRRFHLDALISVDPYLIGNVSPLSEVKPIQDLDEYDAIIGAI